MTSSTWYGPTKSKRAFSVRVCVFVCHWRPLVFRRSCKWLVYVHEKDNNLANICFLFTIAQFDRIRPRPLGLLLDADALSLSCLLVCSSIVILTFLYKNPIQFCRLVISVFVRVVHIYKHQSKHRNTCTKWTIRDRSVLSYPSIIAVLHCSVIVSLHKISLSSPS